MFRQTVEVLFADKGEADDVRRHVSEDGVCADDDEGKCPTSAAADVDDIIKEREEEEAPTGGPEDHSAGPDVFDDGLVEAPEPSGGEAGESGSGEAEGFLVRRFRAAQELAGEDADEGRCAEAEAAEDPGVVGAVAESAEDEGVEVQGEVAFGVEGWGVATGDGDKFQE